MLFIGNIATHMMKKELFATALALALAATASAQGYDYGRSGGRPAFFDTKNMYYGLRLGLALGRVGSDDERLDGSSMQAGLNLGGVIGIQLSPSAPVYLEAGLLFAQKGGKGYAYHVDADGKNVKDKFTFDLNYLEVPIVAKYFVELDDGLTLQPFFGGYLALGVGGSVKDYYDHKEYTSFSDEYFKRFDGGLRLGCGLQYQVVYVEALYDIGLSNISHDSFRSSHTGCLSFNLGVNF